MKTKRFISLLLSTLFVVNIAVIGQKDPSGKIEEQSVAVKEITIIRTECKMKNKRIVCEKNANKQTLSRVVYTLNTSGEWVPYQKYLYIYDTVEDLKPSSICYTYWDKLILQWRKEQTYRIK